MDNQEAFSIVSAHLLKQGRRSVDGWMCRYRGADGCKCAIGALIPDELYDAGMEGLVVSQFLHTEFPRFEGIADLFAKVDLALLERLQGIHDNDEAYEWEGSLREVAKDFSLDFSKLENL